MRFHYSAAALALITTATLAEECPAGYAKAKGIAWVDCDVKGENGSTLQCATIQVPKDWKNDSGPKMPLHLVRQPAKTKSSRGERSVIVNPGGPGASGIQTVVEGGESYQVTFGDDLHIVGFDPRGVGLTLPYTCGTENTKNKKTTRDVREIEDQTPYFNSNVDTADKCAAAQPDGDLIGTAYVARDVKAISESLGEDGLIRYVGYSYGTLLGATLAAMFPTKVDRIVLDGNINPQSYYHKLQTESAASTDDAFRHYFDLCAKAAKGNCAWAEDNKDGAQLTAKFDDFLATLTDEQSTVVRTKFFLMLYHPSQFKSFSSDLQGWKASPSMIPLRNAISDKDKRDKFEVKEYAKESTPEAISGIQCSDKITRFPYGSPENFKKWQEEYRAVTKYAYDTSGNNDLQCSVWKTTAKERFDVPQSGIDTANHILFVNTAYDPVTPLISAVNSAKSFTKSLVLKSSGVGHCSNVNPSQALDDAVKEYMATGTLPKITEYKPDKENVFDEVEGDKANAPVKPTKRDFRYPAFFSKRDETAAAEQIPAGCTKIPMSSSALVSASASVVPSASAFASASMSASVSASQSAEPTPAASPSVSASASESMVLSHPGSASASVLAVPTASVSQSHEPTPSASASASVSPSVSDSLVASHSESASASVVAAPSLSVSHSESALVSATASASISASESLVIFHSSASVSVQQSSESLSALVTRSASPSESHAVSPTPSASAHSESASVSAAHVSPSVSYSGASPSASVSVAGENGSQSSSVAISGSASADLYSSAAIGSASASASSSIGYAATASSVAQSSSYPAESLTHSASATPVYDQDSASITSSASYSAASSVEHPSSSSFYLSSDAQVSPSASSYPLSVPSFSAHVGVSSSDYSDASSSVVSGSASLSYSVPMSSSSAVYSGSSIVYSSVSSSVVYPDASFYPSGSASVDYPQSSQYPSGSSAIIDYTRSSVTGSSSVGSYYAASTPVYSSGSSTSSTSSKTEPIHNHYPTSKPYASSAPIKSVDSKYPYSSSIPGHSSSIAPYPKGDDYAAGGDYPGGNAYTTGYYPVTISGKPKGPKTTSAPCATVAWSSQPGYVPITKTYTTTSVRTITKCPDTVKNCPLNLSTKTYITTEIKTRTTVVATPSSPPTSIKSYPTIKESDKESSAAPSKETGMVGQPSKQTKPITPSQPAKDTGYSSQPSKPTADSPQPPKETKTVQSTHSAYAPLKISSNPSVPTSVPPYPTGPSTPSSIKACNDMKCSYVAISTGTKPFTSTGASTTLKTTTPSVSVCFGNGCKATGTPTGYKPAEFTGAASSNFVSFMVGAGAIIVAFTCFF